MADPSSAVSTPRSERRHPPPPPLHRRLLHHLDGGDGGPADGPKVRLMCSFGGRILPRPHDHQLRYVGGETRIVSIPRAASFAVLLAKLSKLPGESVGSGGAGTGGVRVKYQLPHEDLDALISVSCDEDVEIMMEEYDRLSVHGGGGGTAATRAPRLRLFLFPSNGFGSLHDRWFLDALNCGGAAAGAPPLDGSQSEASSVVSETPDYLFGLDSAPTEGASLPPSTLPPALGPAATLPPSTHPPALGPAATLPPEPLPPVQQAAPVPVYYVPAQPAGPVPISWHMSYGYQSVEPAVCAGPAQAGPVYVGRISRTQTGPVGLYAELPVYSPSTVDGGFRGSMGSINPTARINAFQRGPLEGINRTAKVDP